MTQTKPLPPAPIEPKLAIAAPVYVLTAADRCDSPRCGARAWHRATLYAGDLYFCHHHGKEVRPIMEEKVQVLQWLDESAGINPPKEFYN